MGLLWQFVAGFLYFEVAFVFLLCLEFIAPPRWKKIFNSSIISMLKKGSSQVFYTLLCGLILLFLDSGNRMMKYRQYYEEHKVRHQAGAAVGSDPGAQMFLAQRNLYITGFSLFLLLVMRRMMKLLSQLATLMAREEAALQQARNASTQSERLLEENADLRRDSSKSADRKTEKLDLDEVIKQMQEKTKEVEAAKASLAAMKAQAESTNREYDRLMNEHTQLQESIGGQDKKSD